MLTIGAFSSLAQLGAGLALALAIFTEPIANLEKAYKMRVENLLTLIPDRSRGAGLDRSNVLLQNLIDLDTATDRAKELAILPMWLVKIGAIVNFWILIVATVCPEAELSYGWVWGLLGLSILPIGLGTLCLFLLAHFKIGKKERELSW